MKRVVERPTIEPRKHPSGRPRQQPEYRRLSIARYPQTEPMTPRLRFNQHAPAIGFTVNRLTED